MECDNDIRNRHKVLRKFSLGDMVLRIVRVGDVERKLLPTYELIPYVVIREGERGNYAIQQRGKFKSNLIWEHVDRLKHYEVGDQGKQEAKEQAEDAAQAEAEEYHVEKILLHRGLKQAHLKQGDQREFLVKWTGYDEPSWHVGTDLNNDQMIVEYLREFQKKPSSERTALLQEAKDHEGTILSAASILAVTADDVQVEVRSEREQYIYADILKWNYDDMVNHICMLTGHKPEDILLVWASIPCETFANSAYNVSRGFNYRNFEDPVRAPCCEDPTCKYGALARLHDRMLPQLQKMLSHSQDIGLDFEYFFEHPDSNLQRRPYAQLSNWPVAVSKKKYDMCAFAHPAKKPSIAFTSMNELQLQGETGNGRCGDCCSQRITTNDGRCIHKKAYAQEPSRQLGCMHKSAIPKKLTKEVVEYATQKSRKKKVVIDLFCGRSSIAPVVLEKGLSYVGVDIKKFAKKHTDADFKAVCALAVRNVLTALKVRDVGH